MNTRRKLEICGAAIILAGTAALVANAQNRQNGSVRVAAAASAVKKPALAIPPAPGGVVATIPSKGTPATQPAAKGAAHVEVLISRETYSYPGTGRRDPFVSLMNTEELRPLLADLKLVAIAFDPSGRNSVAVLRDVTNKEQYRVKVGQEIGRMRVAAIREKNVVFGIEEFGYSRQESLAMTDSTKTRTQ